MVALSLPTFWFGLLAIFIFAQTLGWLPAGGKRSTDGGGLLDALRHLILPVAVLALVLVAQWSRYTRSYMLEILNQDFIRTARAKGLRPSRVLVNHALRAALVPLITLGGLQLPLLVGGALVTETVFSWPGMGLLFVNALGSRDYPVLMAILMVGAFVVVLGNLIADIVIARGRPAHEDDACLTSPPRRSRPHRAVAAVTRRGASSAIGSRPWASSSSSRSP